MTIPAIETFYRGFRFRSRLEARWAVVFHKLGIRWDYEPQGYQLGKVSYLPDFWLRDLDVFVEVKGELDTAGADKFLRLAHAHRKGVMLVEDIPDAETRGPDFHIAFADENTIKVHQAAFLPNFESHRGWYPQPLGTGRIINDVDDPGVAAALPGVVTGRDLPRTNGCVVRHASVEAAYDAARQERFERGVRGGAA